MIRGINLCVAAEMDFFKSSGGYSTHTHNGYGQDAQFFWAIQMGAEFIPTTRDIINNFVRNSFVLASKK